MKLKNMIKRYRRGCVLVCNCELTRATSSLAHDDGHDDKNGGGQEGHEACDVAIEAQGLFLAKKVQHRDPRRREEGLTYPLVCTLLFQGVEEMHGSRQRDEKGENREVKTDSVYAERVHARRHANVCMCVSVCVCVTFYVKRIT